MTRRDWLLVLALALGVAQLVFIGSDRVFHTQPTKVKVCTEVHGDADHDHAWVTPGTDYRDGVWYGSDGRVIGYAAYEDSIVYREPDCFPWYK